MTYHQAAGVVATMCHWTQNRGDARNESHWNFHYGSPCPYEAMAVVLRGEPDPRDVPRTGARRFICRVGLHRWGDWARTGDVWFRACLQGRGSHEARGGWER